MKPTVGRIVDYHVSENDSAELKSNSAKKLPAIVSAAWGGETVNLRILADGPHVGWKTSVMMCDAADPQPGYWSWPVKETATANGGENPGGPTPPIPPKGQ